MVFDPPPISTEVFEMRALYWIILNQNTLKTHEANLCTLEASMSHFFVRGGA